MYERIPEELKAVRQWHCWRSVDGVKVPVQTDGKPAKSNDETTWTDFETASDAAQFHSGLAFEITDPWTGIDLDDCIDDNGLKAWAIEILFRFDGIGFAEVSPSGTGIKILTRGRKPTGSRCLHKFEDGKVECYDHKRFWTVTGDLYNGQDQIEDGQAAVDWICRKFFSTEKPEQPPVKPIAVPRLSATPLSKRAQVYLQSVPGESKGNLRNAAFSLSGHLHSMVDDIGGRLTDNEVLDLLREWNQRNTPPLKDSELKEAAVNGRKNGTPRQDKPPQALPERDFPNVDLSVILGEERTDEFDDEEFCRDSVPKSGLIKEIYSYYCSIAHRRSHVMGLATAVSGCETLFGRRIASHTDMRTNDYNVVMAPTSSGKEACESTLTRIFQAADSNRMPLIPPDVQSGNGLVKAVCSLPCALWICDEFGKTLEAILDRKSNNGHAKLIGTHLLKLYSKSSGMYGGAAHADGLRNNVNQPHLCLLGLTTGQIFDSIDSRQIQDGLFGRLAFWPVQNRPNRRSVRTQPVPERLADMVREWLTWEPLYLIADSPNPEVIEFTPDALKRWEDHTDAIDAKMEHENESRAAIWGRVAARAMKLALVHRAARITDRPSVIDWEASVRVEGQDIDWGIRIANWLGRVACGLIRENVIDRQAQRAQQIVLKAVGTLGSVSRSDLLREFRSVSASEFNAAAEQLQKDGFVKITEGKTSGPGRPKITYSRPETPVQNQE